MVKSVDTRDLKSLGESCAGSNPAERTITIRITENGKLVALLSNKGGTTCVADLLKLMHTLMRT